jgi:phage protein D
LIDTLTNDKFINQTASQVATQFAQQAGLVPQVTATTAQIGRYLNQQYGYASQDLSQYRLLSYLAQQEGFDLYVKDKTLVFTGAPPTAAPLSIVYSYGSQGGSLSPGVISANATIFGTDAG